jgi:tRNA (cytidine/uridine-2'-O-)-methyltransferase
LTTQGKRSLFACKLGNDDVFVFGRETSGLPESVLADFAEDARVRIPMQPAVRSLNIANAVAITVYEAWRQSGFAGAC